MNNELREICEIRDYKEADKSFIMATFLRGLYYGNSWFKFIPKNIFMDNYKHIVSTLIQSPNVSIKVVCLKEDQDVILGYSILSSDYQTIHWGHVKREWRKQGIFKTIIPQYPSFVTHLTDVSKQIMIKKLPNTVFNPFNIK